MLLGLQVSIGMLSDGYLGDEAYGNVLRYPACMCNVCTGDFRNSTSNATLLFPYMFLGLTVR